MILSDRLKTIADFVEKGSIVADIGTDHGYIPIYLVENEIAKKVIAADISRDSLQKSIDSVRYLNLEDRIDNRLGDGLELIRPFEIDTLIIAGMGGVLIRDILEANRSVTDSVLRFILQGNTATAELREYLRDNDFVIVDEKLVKEKNQFYEIIVAERGKTFQEDRDFFDIGKKLIEKKDPLLEEYLNHKIDYDRSILDSIRDLDGDRVLEKKDYLSRRINFYKEVLNKIEG